MPIRHRPKSASLSGYVIDSGLSERGEDFRQSDPRPEYFTVVRAEPARHPRSPGRRRAGSGRVKPSFATGCGEGIATHQMSDAQRSRTEAAVIGPKRLDHSLTVLWREGRKI